MRVNCPKCNKAYNLDQERIGQHGVRVKCPDCQQIFTIDPEDKAEKEIKTAQTRTRKKDNSGYMQNSPSAQVITNESEEDDGSFANFSQIIDEDSLEKESQIIFSSENNEQSNKNELETNEQSDSLKPGGFSSFSQPQITDPSYIAEKGGKIPFRYAIYPALIPLLMFTAYLLFLHYPQFFSLRVTRQAKDSLSFKSLVNDTEVLYNRAKLLQFTANAENYQRAIRLLDLALETQPENVKLMGSKAEIISLNYALTKNEEPLSLSLQTLARDKNNAPALRALTYYFLPLDLKTAGEYLKRLELLQSKANGIIEAETRWLMGRYNIQLSNNQQATLNLEKAIELNPYLLQCYLDLAEIWKRKNMRQMEERYYGLYKKMKARLNKRIKQISK